MLALSETTSAMIYLVEQTVLVSIDEIRAAIKDNFENTRCLSLHNGWREKTISKTQSPVARLVSKSTQHPQIFSAAKMRKSLAHIRVCSKSHQASIKRGVGSNPRLRHILLMEAGDKKQRACHAKTGCQEFPELEFLNELDVGKDAVFFVTCIYSCWVSLMSHSCGRMHMAYKR
ncbi:hypothetical protein BJ741DRAFT_117676 [Chytriomyces cf. hyalinus JEL632]|nr:hypothetical protein BJ741DRAFT_117676 [Chytriomyces cf. hyalinus JEL632]